MDSLLIIKMATKYNIELMGDDFIGYKFVGEDANFWNDIISRLCDYDEIRDNINKKNLLKNNISFSDYDNKRWCLE